MNSERMIAKRGSYKIEVEAGQTYSICSCGYSKNQPFCDGSHTNYNGFIPIKYEATETKLVSFCGCKHSDSMPICDGKHKTL